MHDIKAVCDVRSVPYSKYVKWSSHSNLKRLLDENDLGHEYLGNELGGKRHMEFSEIAKLESFKKGLTKLFDMTENSRVAIMCAEENPRNCHREALIARNLFKYYPDDIEILHIRGDGEIEKSSDLYKKTQLCGEQLYLNL